ncbi:pilus assembly protein [Halopseudomonas sp.]|jgi:type IV pilus assembly protein PilY1|uniref:pilus assembly protein n=1 Tax=Halopseudomonas sp. TaxID=2901191 RepID=UPI0039E48EC2
MNSYKSLTKTALSCLVFSLYLHGGVIHAAALDVSQQPLMLVDSVPPNLIFTMDDSGSMQWAFAPDLMGANNNAVRNDRRSKSGGYNGMYYDPDIEYLGPVRLEADGSTASPGYTTSFTSASHNGLRSDLGTTNLSTSYRVSWNDNINTAQNYTYTSQTNYAAPTGTIPNLAENPAADFTAIYDRGNNGTSNPIPTSGGMTFTITRTNNNTSNGCTATANFNGVNFNNVPCTRNGNRSTATLARTPVPAYYYKLNDGCTKGTDDEDCYTLVPVSNISGPGGVDERQNFANWYSFYRNRALATLSAATLAFNEVPPSTRFTWQSLGNCTSLNSSSCNNNRFRNYSAQHKSNFFEWMRNLNFNQGTPLRASLDRAGKFLQTNAAWAANPNPFTSSGGNGATVTDPVLACRPSYHIMMTDGMWNGADGSPEGTLRADHSSFNLSDGKDYNGLKRPYADTTTNTLADLAMHYWATDLRPTLDNDLKPYNRFTSTSADEQYWDPRNNPAAWQHMVNFTVGLALTSALDQAGLEWTGSTFAGQAYQNLLNGPESWPAAGASSNNNVYDLWHTAINSRGEFFSADSPEALVRSFQDVLSRIAERNSTAGRPGVSSSVSLNASNPGDINVVNRIFESSYDSTAGWTGDLVRKDVTRTPGGTVSITEEWSASEEISNQEGGRTILMGGGNGASGLENFSWANLTAEQQAFFNLNPDGLTGSTDGRGAARVDFILGERDGEGTGDSDFRARTSVFGDIINSSPAVVGAASNVPYLMDRIDGTRGAYLEYLRQTAERPELIYVGANDGMLHAIHSGESEGYEGGTEAFAFIPTAVIPNLPLLTGQSYQGGEHRFFVDGSPIVRDVYIQGEWRTVLVGTLRAGGKSIFALDITNPGINGAGVELLWEISNETEDYGDLGYTFARPEIVRLHSGEWAVLLGNGYDSTNPETGVNDVAALFVIDISNGEKLSQLTVDDNSGLPNGLSSVRGADNNSDGIVDYAYAGDLRGNLWRFDLISTGNVGSAPDPFARSVQGLVSPSNFEVAYGGQPIFRARFNGDENLPQAITAIPSLVRHPSRRGYLVIVGTGKYFETSDAAPDTSKANSIYAVWDRYTRAQSTTGADARANRSNMEQRTITTQETTTFTGDAGSTTSLVRVINDGRIEWYNPGTTPTQEASEGNVRRRGWFLDLNVSNSALDGEMMVNEMLARGSTLLFSTNIPNDDPCADGLTSFIYGINAQTGARTLLPPFDFNRDGKITAADSNSNGVPPSGIQIGAPGGVALTGDGLIYGNDDTLGFFVPPAEQGRQTWQYLPEQETP